MFCNHKLMLALFNHGRKNPFVGITMVKFQFYRALVLFPNRTDISSTKTISSKVMM